MTSDQPTPEDPTSQSTRLTHIQSLMDRLRASAPIYAHTLPSIDLTSSPQRGQVFLTLRLTSVHLNSRGHLHGAVSATIIDFTTGLAICAWDLRPATGASVDMNISFISAAKEGDLLEIEASAEKVGGSLSFVRVRINKVEQNGERTIVTVGQHTKYLRPKPKVEG